MKKFFKVGTVVAILGLTLILAYGVNRELIDHHIGDNNTHLQAKDNRLVHAKSSGFDQLAEKHANDRIISVGKFKRIKLNNVKAAAVSVSIGNRYQVRIRDNKDATITAKVAHDELEISEYGIGFAFGKHGWANKGHKFAVDVIVPAKASLSEITGKQDAGSFKLANLSLQKLDVKTNAGKCKLTNVQIKQQGKINTDVSQLYVSHSELNNFAYRSRVGSVRVNNSRLLGSNYFSSNIGDFVMRQAQIINYNFSTSMGGIKFLGRQKGKKFIKNVGSKNSLKVVTIMGAISVK